MTRFARATTYYSSMLALRCAFEMVAQFKRFEQFGDADPRVPTGNGQRGAQAVEQYQREVKVYAAGLKKEDEILAGPRSSE